MEQTEENLFDQAMARYQSGTEAIELIKSYNGNEGRIRLTGFISRFGSSYDADVVLTSTGKYKLDWGQDEQKKINL